uniref:Uncharacterized protein n=1 Tax=Coccolithus braarudii TaxID=221442 RepID=A0A7S0LDL5_9EUKA|mmetsp:Transcript_29254/g.62865  ORF Transcript_29254/g.62865 Transcript_29254/m.62865 type:complete len:130 (+) Transcript_29254:179-568(+)
MPSCQGQEQGQEVRCTAVDGRPAGEDRMKDEASKTCRTELEAPQESDWGKLPKGTLVLDALHTNFLIKGKLVYGDNPETVEVPAEQVLHVFYEMAPYALPKTPKWAHITGAVQLSPQDYETSMAELRDR